MAQWVKNLPAMQETQEMQVQSLGWEDLLEKEMVTYCSILAWRIPRTEEPGRLYSPWCCRKLTWDKSWRKIAITGYGGWEWGQPALTLSFPEFWSEEAGSSHGHAHRPHPRGPSLTVGRAGCPWCFLQDLIQRCPTPIRRWFGIRAV